MITDFEGVLFLDSDTDDERTDNRPSRFHTFMHSSFLFESDDFEVGLLEMQLPYTWKNLTTDQFVAGIDADACSGKYRIPAGCYYNTVDLVDKINRFFVENRDPPRLIYDPLFNRVRSKAGSHTVRASVHIVCTKELAQVLGMSYWFGLMSGEPPEGKCILYKEAGQEDRLVKYGKWPKESIEVMERPVNLQASLERLYISSSIVKHRAHSQHELLRVIPLARNLTFGEIDVISHDRPVFVPIAHQSFDRIEICLRDKNGKEPEFTSGNVIVTLEFRRRRDG